MKDKQNINEKMRRVCALLDLTSEAKVFIFDSELYKGDSVSLVKRYVDENPSLKFRSWLINKGLRIDTDFEVEAR